VFTFPGHFILSGCGGQLCSLIIVKDRYWCPIVGCRTMARSVRGLAWTKQTWVNLCHLKWGAAPRQAQDCTGKSGAKPSGLGLAVSDQLKLSSHVTQLFEVQWRPKNDLYISDDFIEATERWDIFKTRFAFASANSVFDRKASGPNDMSKPTLLELGVCKQWRFVFE